MTYCEEALEDNTIRNQFDLYVGPLDTESIEELHELGKEDSTKTSEGADHSAKFGYEDLIALESVFDADKEQVRGFIIHNSCGAIHCLMDDEQCNCCHCGQEITISNSVAIKNIPFLCEVLFEEKQKRETQETKAIKLVIVPSFIRRIARLYRDKKNGIREQLILDRIKRLSISFDEQTLPSFLEDYISASLHIDEKEVSKNITKILSLLDQSKVLLSDEQHKRLTDLIAHWMKNSTQSCLLNEGSMGDVEERGANDASENDAFYEDVMPKLIKGMSPLLMNLSLLEAYIVEHEKEDCLHIDLLDAIKNPLFFMQHELVRILLALGDEKTIIEKVIELEKEGYFDFDSLAKTKEISARLHHFNKSIRTEHPEEWRVISQQLQKEQRDKFLSIYFNPNNAEESTVFGKKICHLLSRFRQHSDLSRAEQTSSLSASPCQSSGTNEKMQLMGRLLLSCLKKPTSHRAVDTQSFYMIHDWLQTMIESKPYFLDEIVVTAIIKAETYEPWFPRSIFPQLLSESNDQSILLNIARLLIETDLDHTDDRTQAEWGNQLIELFESLPSNNIPLIGRLIHTTQLMLNSSIINHTQVTNIIIEQIKSQKTTMADAFIIHFQDRFDINDTQRILEVAYEQSQESHARLQLIETKKPLFDLFIYQWFGRNLTGFQQHAKRLIEAVKALAKKDHLSTQDYIRSAFFTDLINALTPKQISILVHSLYRIKREEGIEEDDETGINIAIERIKEYSAPPNEGIYLQLETLFDDYKQMHIDFSDQLSRLHPPISDRLREALLTENVTLTEWNALQDSWQHPFAFAVKENSAPNRVRYNLSTQQGKERFHLAAFEFFTKKQKHIKTILATIDSPAFSKVNKTQYQWLYSLNKYSASLACELWPKMLDIGGFIAKVDVKKQPGVYRNEKPVLEFSRQSHVLYKKEDPRLDKSRAAPHERYAFKKQDVQQALFLLRASFSDISSNYPFIATNDCQAIADQFIVGFSSSDRKTKVASDTTAFCLGNPEQLSTDRAASSGPYQHKYRMTPNHLKETVRQTTKDDTIGIIPIQIDDNHWAVIFVEKNTNTAYFIDPSAIDSCFKTNKKDEIFLSTRSLFQDTLPELTLHSANVIYQLRDFDSGSNVIRIIEDMLEIASRHAPQLSLHQLVTFLEEKKSVLQPKGLILGTKNQSQNALALGYDKFEVHEDSVAYKMQLAERLFSTFVFNHHSTYSGIVPVLKTQGNDSYCEIQQADNDHIQKQINLLSHQKEQSKMESEILRHWKTIPTPKRILLIESLIDEDSIQSEFLDFYNGLLIQRVVLLPLSTDSYHAVAEGMHNGSPCVFSKRCSANDIIDIIFNPSSDEIDLYIQHNFRQLLENYNRNLQSLYKISTRVVEILASSHLHIDRYSSIDPLIKTRIKPRLDEIFKEWIARSAEQIFLTHDMTTELLITLSHKYHTQSELRAGFTHHFLASENDPFRQAGYKSLPPLLQHHIDNMKDNCSQAWIQPLLDRKIQELSEAAKNETDSFFRDQLTVSSTSLLQSTETAITVESIAQQTKQGLASFLSTFRFFNITENTQVMALRIISPILSSAIENFLINTFASRLDLDLIINTSSELALIPFLKIQFKKNRPVEFKQISNCDQSLLNEDIKKFISNEDTTKTPLIEKILSHLAEKLHRDKPDESHFILRLLATFLITKKASYLGFFGAPTEASFLRLFSCQTIRETLTPSSYSGLSSAPSSLGDDFTEWMTGRTSAPPETCLVSADSEAKSHEDSSGLIRPPCTVKGALASLTLISCSNDQSIVTIRPLRILSSAIVSLDVLLSSIDTLNKDPEFSTQSKKTIFNRDYIINIQSQYHQLLDLLDPLKTTTSITMDIVSERINACCQTCRQWFFSRSGNSIGRFSFSAFGNNLDASSSRAPMMWWIVDHLSSLLSDPCTVSDYHEAPHAAQTLMHQQRSGSRAASVRRQNTTSSDLSQTPNILSAPPSSLESHVAHLLSFSSNLQEALNIELSYQYRRLLSLSHNPQGESHQTATQFWHEQRNQILSSDFNRQILWLFENKNQLSTAFLNLSIHKLTNQPKIMALMECLDTPDTIETLEQLLHDTIFFDQQLIPTKNVNDFIRCIDFMRSISHHQETVDATALFYDLSLKNSMPITQHIPAARKSFDATIANMLALENTDGTFTILHMNEWIQQLLNGSIDSVVNIKLPPLKIAEYYKIECHPTFVTFKNENIKNTALISTLLHCHFPEKSVDFISNQVEHEQNFIISAQGEHIDLLTTIVTTPENLYFLTSNTLICIDEFLMLLKAEIQGFTQHVNHSIDLIADKSQEADSEHGSHQELSVWLSTRRLSNLFPHPLQSIIPRIDPIKKEDIALLSQCKTLIDGKTISDFFDASLQTIRLALSRMNDLEYPINLNDWRALIDNRATTLADIPSSRQSNTPSVESCQAIISLALSYLAKDTASALANASADVMAVREKDLEDFTTSVSELPEQERYNIYHHEFRTINDNAETVFDVINSKSFAGYCIHGQSSQLLQAVAYWYPEVILTLDTLGIKHAYTLTYPYKRGVDGTISEGYWNSLSFLPRAVELAEKIVAERQEAATAGSLSSLHP